jgi:hypothetical protein
MLTPEARQLERALTSKALPELFPPDTISEFVVPDYDGHSLANVPATLAALLGAHLGDIAAPPLDRAYWGELAQGTRRVVLVLLDALGYLQLAEMLRRHPDCVWGRLARQGTLLPMTSVVPSTTTTALATLLTGTEPVVHGLLGYELWLREYGVLTEMLSLAPVYSPRKESLVDWGLVPGRFLPVPSLGGLLSAHKVASTAVVPAQHMRSPLTRICYRGFDRMLGYTSLVGLWALTRHALCNDESERSLYFLYWGGIDAAIHRHGTAGGFWEKQFQMVSEVCDREFLSPLTPQQREGTLFIMIADHGFVDAPIDLAHDADADSTLRRMLLVPHSGESRVAFLHALHGDDESTWQLIKEDLGPDYVVVRTRDAVGAGLFGRGTPGPESLARLGHFIVLSRGLHYLDRLDRRSKMRGRHGGLSGEEMLVPWLAVRLDG